MFRTIQRRKKTIKGKKMIFFRLQTIFPPQSPSLPNGPRAAERILCDLDIYNILYIPYHTISQRYCMPFSACRTYILPSSISHCLLLPSVVLFDLTTSREATFWHDLIVLPISNGSALIALTFMNSNEKYPQYEISLGHT